MNKKLIAGVVVVVFVGVVGYQFLFRGGPPVLEPMSPASEIVRECPGDGAYLEGTEQHFSDISELGSFWVYTPEPSINTELLNLLVEHPIVCSLTEQYELVYRFPTGMVEIFTARNGLSGAKLFVRDRQSGQEVLLTEQGPAPISNPNSTSSGGMAGIFLTMRPNGILDLSSSGSSDAGGGVTHSLFNPKTRAVLEYSFGSLYRNRSTIRIKKDGKEWTVNPVVTESTTGEGVNAVGVVVVKGIAVNGTFVKTFNVTRDTSIETFSYPIGPGLNYGVALGTSRNVSIKGGYHTLDDVYVNDDFSKMMFTVRLSVQNPAGGEETVGLGNVEIDLR